MGFLDTKTKAAQFEKQQADARAADLHNAGIAGYTKALDDAKLAIMQNEYLKGLAAQGMNPQGFANVPGKEMGAGYQMPGQGETNMQMYKRPVQQPAQQGLGWSSAMGSGLIQ